MLVVIRVEVALRVYIHDTYIHKNNNLTGSCSFIHNSAP